MYDNYEYQELTKKSYNQTHFPIFGGKKLAIFSRLLIVLFNFEHQILIKWIL